MFFSFMRCFNVAAITALAVWYGYAFYLKPMPAGSYGPIYLSSVASSSSTGAAK